MDITLYILSFNFQKRGQGSPLGSMCHKRHMHIYNKEIKCISNHSLIMDSSVLTIHSSMLPSIHVPSIFVG
jgi:hypothetical protein